MTQPGQLSPNQGAPDFAAPPFAGFLQRVAAFSIDLVLIYFVGFTLEMLLRAPLTAMDPFFSLISFVAAFCYFWLGNGPVGRGATMGKAILNMHVVDAHGKTLGLGPSFRRALLQFPLIYPAIFQFFGEALNLSPFTMFYILEPPTLVRNAIVVALFYSLITHPMRRGAHDMWAGSFVTGHPTPKAFHEKLAEPPDVALRLRLFTHRRATMILFAALIALMFGNFALTLRGPQTREAFALLEAYEKAAPIERYRVAEERLFNSGQWVYYEQFTLGRPAPPMDAQDAATTNTADIGPYTSSFRLVKRRGVTRDEEFTDARFQEQVDALRRAHWNLWRSRLAQEADVPTTHPLRFAALFGDRFRFVGFSIGGEPSEYGMRPRWIAEGPADPQAGELAYRRVIESEPASEPAE